jgi:hypothetical protein
MSADNWGKCPRCIREQTEVREQAQREVEEAYGVVGRAEFLRRQANANAQGPVSVEDTLREDYEIRISEEGRFSVDYAAACEVCGFKFAYRHEEAVLEGC